MVDRKRIKLLCAACFVLGASVALISGSLITFLWIRHYRHTAQVNARTASEQTRAPGTPGPWGVLEPIQIPLANPDGVIPDQDERFQDPKWFFEKYSQADLTRFFLSCDLRPVEQRILMDVASWEISDEGISVFPPEAVVWALSPRVRQQIYSVLEKSTSNYAQCFPFRFAVGGLDSKLQGSGLDAAEIERVKRLAYTNANYVCLTDLELIRRVLKPADFKNVLEMLYVIPTYFLRVRVPPNADVEALVKYWGKGGREKRIAPLLNSVARAPGAAVNVSYLLPTFARLRLYTYPDSWSDPTVKKQDCFFTAMNFFNETPNTNFFDLQYSRKILSSDYAPVEDQPVFGDILTLFNEAGEAIHTCVYVADDFVFTKNGINPAQPWVIMRIPDMLLIYYTSEKHGGMMFLRRKVQLT
jgi:hypothetical protein